MAYYLQSTTEENLYLCILNKLWGSKTKKLSGWHNGDFLIAYVDRRLAALFTIQGEPFFDERSIWPQETYPYRISLHLEKIVHPDHRYSISSKDTRDTLFKYHSPSYAVPLVLAARPLNETPAKLLIKHLSHSPSWDEFDVEQALWEIQTEKNAEQSRVIEEVVSGRPTITDDVEKPSLHTEMQYYLAQLGRSMNFQVWIPKADQGLFYKDVQLRQLSEENLPDLPFSEEVLRIIRNIDVIWLSDSNPTHLFEIEHTTTIYSGLLRMSDLITLIPSLNISMYICAPTERKTKVTTETNRPTFSRRKLPLVQICRFISFEKITEFMAAYQKVLRHLTTSILEEISETLEN